MGKDLYHLSEGRYVQESYSKGKRRSAFTCPSCSLQTDKALRISILATVRLVLSGDLERD